MKTSMYKICIHKFVSIESRELKEITSRIQLIRIRVEILDNIKKTFIGQEVEIFNNPVESDNHLN